MCFPCNRNLVYIILHPEVLSALSPESVSFSSSSSSSYETFDGIDLGLSFQYPANRIKFEAGFDPAFINKTDGLKHGEEYIIWEYDFPQRFYGWIEPPYYSALAQAESIYVLALAFDLTNDEKYLLVANMAMKAFFVDYDAGGYGHGRDP